MPVPYVRKVAKKHHKSVGATEERWAKAKRVAAEQGHGGDYGYVTGIFKKMVGENMAYPTFKTFLILESDVEAAPGQSFSLEPNMDDEHGDPSSDDITQDMANDELGMDAEATNAQHPVDLENDERFLEILHAAERGQDPKAQGMVNRIRNMAQNASPAEVENEIQTTWENMFGGKGVRMSGADDMHHMGQQQPTAPTAPPMGESLLAQLFRR